MADSTDSNESRKAIREQIESLKKQHREEEIARRKALQEHMQAFMQQQREEDEAHKKAVREQIESLKKQFVEEHNESKRGLRDQIAEKITRVQEEHQRMHHADRLGEGRFFGENDLGKGFLKIHVLLSLSIRPAHGYELIHWISHHTGHSWKPSPGSMYPALESLEANGFIAAQGDGRRKVYSLTPKGEDAIVQIKKMREKQAQEMKSFLSALLEE